MTESTEATPHELEAVEELVQMLSLVEIRFYELNATADDQVEPRETALDAPIEVRTAFRKRPDGVDYRLEVEIERPTGRIRVDAAALYAADVPFEVSDDVLLDFGDNVAIMAMYPYLRQAISDLGQRLGDSVVLPMLQRGAITFERGGRDKDRAGEDPAARRGHPSAAHVSNDDRGPT